MIKPMILIGHENTKYLKMDEKEQSYTPFSEKWSIKTNTFFKNIISLLSNKKIALPKGTVYYDCVGKGATFVIQEPPAIRTISLDYDLPSIFYDMKKKRLLKMYDIPENFAELIGEPPYRISLGFPYIIYVVSIDLRDPIDSIRLKLFYSPTEINSENDHVYDSNFLNVNGNGFACLGHKDDHIGFISSAVGVPKKYINELGVKKIIETTINYFWNSIFNDDIIGLYQAYSDDIVLGNFLKWNYWTRTDPISFYKKINYLNKKKLSDFVTNCNTNQIINSLCAVFNQPANLFSEIENNFSLKYYLSGLYVGDIVNYLGEKYKIKGFYCIGTENHISLERERDKKQIFVAESQNILSDFLNQTKQTTVSINNQLFRINDNIIIEFLDGSFVIDKISSITNYNNEVSLILKDGFIFSLNNKAIKTIKKLDPRNIEIGEYKFKRNTDFYLISEQNLALPLSKVSKITFDVANYEYDNLTLIFRKNYIKNAEYTLNQFIAIKNQGKIKDNLSFLDNFEKYPFFLYYDKIQHNEIFFDKETKNYYCLYEDNINKKPFFDHIINNNYKKIEIPGYARNISLAAEDHVVFVENETSIHDIYKIKEFIIVEAENPGEEKNINISLENIKTGNCIIKQFIENDSLVYPHRIRKISFNFNCMSSGENYIIKKPLKNFYKKYVYKLLYFLIDGKKVAAVFDNGIPVYVEDNFQEFFEKTNNPQKENVKIYTKKTSGEITSIDRKYSSVSLFLQNSDVKILHDGFNSDEKVVYRHPEHREKFIFPRPMTTEKSRTVTARAVPNYLGEFVLSKNNTCSLLTIFEENLFDV